MISAMSSIVVLGILLAICIAFRGQAIKSGAIRQTREGRLLRVKNASFVVIALLLLCLPLGIYQFVAFLNGWNRLGSDEICKVVVLQHVYAGAAEMPSEVLWLWLVKQGLGWFAAIMLFRLFWLYRGGVLFSKKNITCIRFQGYCLIIGNFIDLELQHFVRASEVSMNPIMMGFLIIFVAWIMDEGRKIQEEQELTV